MDKDLFNSLFLTWKEKEEKVLLSKKRRYPHLDFFIKFNEQRQQYFYKYFLDPKTTVGSHQFYPFIKADIVTPRYKKTDSLNKDGKPTRTIDIKERPIAYASHTDAHIYSWYSNLLTAYYESYIRELGIYDNVSAYLEKGKNNIHFAKEVFDFINEHYLEKGTPCVAMAFDISSFFDGLDHEILYNKWCQVLNKPRLPKDHFKVYKSLVEYTFVQKQVLENEFASFIINAKKNKRFFRYCTPKEFREKIKAAGHLEKNPFTNAIKGSKRFGQSCGIPQGSPISACLSNIYMIDFDIAISQEIRALGGIYRRYCDDIIVVSNIEHSERIKEIISKTILSAELCVNHKKTEVIIFKENKKGFRGFDEQGKLKNLQYLGFEFNGQNIYIRAASMSRYYRRMTARIRKNLKAAYGGNSIGDHVFRKKLLNRYTSKGERNFISYAERAKNIMDSATILKQYKNNQKKVNSIFIKKKNKFEEKLSKKGKLNKSMK